MSRLPSLGEYPSKQAPREVHGTDRIGEGPGVVEGSGLTIPAHIDGVVVARVGNQRGVNATLKTGMCAYVGVVLEGRWYPARIPRSTTVIRSEDAAELTGRGHDRHIDDPIGIHRDIDVGATVIREEGVDAGITDLEPGRTGVGGFVDAIGTAAAGRAEDDAGVEGRAVRRIAGECVRHSREHFGPGAPGVGRSKDPDISANEVVRGVDGDDEGRPTRCDSDNIAADHVAPDTGETDSVGGAEQTGTRAAEAGEATEFPYSRQQSQVGAVGRVERDGTDGE